VSKFIRLSEVQHRMTGAEPVRTAAIHVNVDSILHFEEAKKGSGAMSLITLAGEKKAWGTTDHEAEQRVLHVAETTDELKTLLGRPIAALRHLSGMGRPSTAAEVLFVPSSGVRLVTSQRDRPGETKAEIAEVEFLDGSVLRVDDATALIAIL